MSVHASSDLEELFRLDITFDTPNGITIETRNFSDRARRVRQGKSVTRWKNSTCLGQGASGTVWMQQEEQVPENCRAVKQICKGTRSAPLPVDYRRELLALGRLSKRNDVFVQFLGWYEDNYSVYLAMEYFEQGDLARHLTSPLPEGDVKTITKQLLEGLAVLHSQNWAHRDLKPPNIFVVDKSPWWVKIGDFGISKRIRSGNTRFQTMIGTPEFVAPEVLHVYDVGAGDDTDDDDNDQEYTVAVDLWSLGCVMFLLLTSEVPFTNRKKLRAYCRSKIDRFPIGLVSRFAVSAAAIEMMKQLLEPLPSNRTTALGALDHTWLQEASELPVGHSTPPAPSAEVARHRLHNKDFQAEGRTSIEGDPQKNREKSLLPGLNERFASKNNIKTTIYKPSSSPQTQAQPDREKPKLALQANIRADGRLTAENSFSDTRRASPVMLSERTAKKKREIKQKSKQQTTSKSDRNMNDGKQLDQLGIDAIPKDLQQDAGRENIVVPSIRPASPAQTMSTPNETGAPSAPAGYTLPYGPKLSTKLREMEFRKALIIDRSASYEIGPWDESSYTSHMPHLYTDLHQNSGNPRKKVMAISDYWTGKIVESRLSTIRALRWLVQDAKSGDSFFLIFMGPYPSNPVRFGKRGDANEDELCNFLTQPLPVGVQLTVIVDQIHLDPPLRMDYRFDLSADSTTSLSWPVIRREGIHSSATQTNAQEPEVKPRSFFRQLLSPRSTVPKKSSDRNGQAAIHVWYHSLGKGLEEYHIDNDDPLSQLFLAILREYRLNKTQLTYRDVLRRLDNFSDISPVLASNYPIDIDSVFHI